MDIRQGQQAIAQNNPSILSNLVGSQGGSQPMQAPQPQASVGQAEQAAADLSTRLYGGGFVGGAEGQREAQMQELFNYDQMLEQNYSPFPEVAGYVNNPADQARAIGAVARQTAGNIGQTSGNIDLAERAYQTAVGSVLDRFTDFIKMQQEQKMMEEQMKIEREKLDIQRRQAGGSGNNLGKMIALLAGGGMGGSQKFNGMEVMPSNFMGPLGRGQIRESDALALGYKPQAAGQDQLMQALTLAQSPQEVSTVLSLWDMLGKDKGGLSDESAMIAVMQNPAGMEILKNTPAEQRPAMARQIMASGGPQSLNMPQTSNLSDSQKSLLFQYKSMGNNFNELKSLYSQVPSYGKGTGAQAALGGLLGRVGRNVPSQFEDTRQALIAPVARVLSGESGQLNESDIRRAEGMIPSLRETEEEARDKFERLDTMLNQRMALIQTGQSQTPFTPMSQPGGFVGAAFAGQEPIQIGRYNVTVEQ